MSSDDCKVNPRPTTQLTKQKATGKSIQSLPKQLVGTHSQQLDSVRCILLFVPTPKEVNDLFGSRYEEETIS